MIKIEVVLEFMVATEDPKVALASVEGLPLVDTRGRVNLVVSGDDMGPVDIFLSTRTTSLSGMNND